MVNERIYIGELNSWCKPICLDKKARYFWLILSGLMLISGLVMVTQPALVVPGIVGIVLGSLTLGDTQIDDIELTLDRTLVQNGERLPEDTEYYQTVKFDAETGRLDISINETKRAERMEEMEQRLEFCRSDLSEPIVKSWGKKQLRFTFFLQIVLSIVFLLTAILAPDLSWWGRGFLLYGVTSLGLQMGNMYGFHGFNALRMLKVWKWFDRDNSDDLPLYAEMQNHSSRDTASVTSNATHNPDEPQWSDLYSDFSNSSVEMIDNASADPDPMHRLLTRAYERAAKMEGSNSESLDERYGAKYWG